MGEDHRSPHIGVFKTPLTLTLSLCMDRGDGRHLFGDMVDGVILPIGLM